MFRPDRQSLIRCADTDVTCAVLGTHRRADDARERSGGLPAAVCKAENLSANSRRSGRFTPYPASRNGLATSSISNPQCLRSGCPPCRYRGPATVQANGIDVQTIPSVPLCRRISEKCWLPSVGGARPRSCWVSAIEWGGEACSTAYRHCEVRTAGDASGDGCITARNTLLPVCVAVERRVEVSAPRPWSPSADGEHRVCHPGDEKISRTGSYRCQRRSDSASQCRSRPNCTASAASIVRATRRGQSHLPAPLDGSAQRCYSTICERGYARRRF